MFKFTSYFYVLIMFVILSGCTSPHLDIFPDLKDPSLTDKKISAKLLRSDIQAFYIGALERHPALEKYADKTKLKSMVRSLQNQITEPMTRIEFYRVVGRLTHLFNDGHSMLIWPYQEYNLLKDNGVSPFPFKIDINQDGHVYIINNYINSTQSKLMAGSELIAINDIPVNELVNQMQQFVGGESKYLREQFVANRFGIYLWSVFGFIDQFNLKIKSNNKDSNLKISKVQNWQVFNSSQDANLSSSSNKKTDENHSSDFYYKTIGNETGFLYIAHFDIDPDWFEGFVDDAFTKIKQQKLKALIIDVRDNKGGNTDTATYLASYLTKKSFRMISSMQEKLNSDNRGIFHYKGAIGELNTQVWDDWVEPQANYKRFSGKTYLLISPITYSSGIVFATSLKDNNMATLIGQTTGGNANQTAQGNLFNLPHSQLRAYITTRLLVRPNGSKVVNGVVPHFITTPTKRSIIEQRDLALEKAMALIKQEE